MLARAIDDPSMERYRTGSVRRRISVLQAVLSVIFVTVPQLLFHWHRADPSIPLWGFALAAAVLYIPWMLVTGMLNGSVSGIFDLRDVQLDEIERRDRDAAYRTAYRVFIPVTTVILGVVCAFAASGNGAWAFWLAALLFFAQLGLPQHITAWRLAARGDADEARDDQGPRGP